MVGGCKTRELEPTANGILVTQHPIEMSTGSLHEGADSPVFTKLRQPAGCVCGVGRDDSLIDVLTPGAIDSLDRGEPLRCAIGRSERTDIAGRPVPRHETS